MANKKPNFIVIRPLLKTLHDMGNRGTVTKMTAQAAGIAESEYLIYEDRMKKLYEATVAYVRAKNEVSAVTDERLNSIYELRNAVYMAWNTVLECGEKERLSSDLRVMPTDVDSLCGFTEIFVNDRNDLSFGEDKNFYAKKLLAAEDYKKFKKKVETLLGIRIAKCDMLTSEELEYLRTQRMLCGKVRKYTAGIADADKKIDAIKAIQVKYPATKEDLDRDIKEISDAKKKIEEALASAKKSLSELKAPDTLSAKVK